MKTIKPLKLGVVHRTFERHGQAHLVVSVMVFFPLDDSAALLQEAHLWNTIASELGDTVFDEGMFKLGAEFVVHGSAYAPDGHAATIVPVDITVGDINKRLAVIGDRVWSNQSATDPHPFTEMPVAWTRAFGGEGHEANPVGVGLRGSASELLLPNVEQVDDLISSRRDHPHPAGLGPLPFDWPTRQKHSGSYDEAWLETRYPGYPDDLGWELFNVASADQRSSEAFGGGAALRIHNMHPDVPLIEGTLPDLAVRVFLGKDGETLTERPTRFDTLHLFPHRMRGVAVYRAVAEVDSDDAADIAHLVIAADRPDARRPTAHFEGVLRARLDEETKHLAALRDSDLLPANSAADRHEHAALPDSELFTLQGVLGQNMRRRVEREHAAAKTRIEQLEIEGVDVGALLPPLDADPDPIPIDELGDFVAEQMEAAKQAQADAATMKEEALDKVRALCGEQESLDFDTVMAQAAASSGGPPKLTADGIKRHLDALLEQARAAGGDVSALEEKLADPALSVRLDTMEETVLAGYRAQAHRLPPAARRPTEESGVLRQAVIDAMESGDSMSGWDLTGVDLQGVSLRDADLEETLLEAAVLCSADLSGANLVGACLVRADLSDATLAGARLDGANLANASLRGAKLDGVSIERANLTACDLHGASLSKAVLSDTDLSEAMLQGATLAGVTARGVFFIKTQLSDVDFCGATLEKCSFIEANVSGANFSNANMRSSTFVTCEGTGVVLSGARADNVRIVAGSNMTKADFTGASLCGANFRGTTLRGAHFDRAKLDASDLSECDLRDATFAGARGVGAMLVRADLRHAHAQGSNFMQAILQKSHLEGADFEGANLFRADFAHVRGDDETTLRNANVKQVRRVTRKKSKANANGSAT